MKMPFLTFKNPSLWLKQGLLMIVATTTPKVDLTQHQIFNSVIKCWRLPTTLDSLDFANLNSFTVENIARKLEVLLETP